jgi:L-alanine-DL-glutamate epimerase-like enolase superfamily enzyme
MSLPPIVLQDVSCRALSVPLVEPFRIATATMTTTRAALVELTLQGGTTGLGEAAALPGVTVEDQPELLEAIGRAAPRLAGQKFERLDEMESVLEEALPSRVARAGVEMAILDAWARTAGLPIFKLLAPNAVAKAMRTDITLPIGEPSHMAELALGWRVRGFTVFKVKVGRALEDDLAALDAVAKVVKDASFRLDANEGFSADDAVRFIDGLVDRGLSVECFEQPCKKTDLVSMAQVARAAARHRVPVVADESARDVEDVDRLAKANAATGVNLKLVKTGGILAAHRLGVRAQQADFRIMSGAMVETRLGLTAMAHVVTALGGVDYVDLDTAFLLADDPFRGGYSSKEPDLFLTGGPGLDVSLHSIH